MNRNLSGTVRMVNHRVDQAFLVSAVDVAFLFLSPLLRAFRTFRAFRARIISPSPFLFLAPATQAKNDFLFNNDY